MRLPHLLVLAPLFATPLHAQSDVQPPAKAATHFATQHPNAVVKEWELRKRNYRVEYTEKGVEYDSYYTPEGAWVRTEQEIGPKDLPTTVTAALKAGKYSTWRVDDVEKHATPEHAVLYKVKVEKLGKVMALYHTPDGKLIKEKEDR